MVTYDEAVKYYEYNPDTGVFRWAAGAPSKGKIGKITGCPNKGGYLRLSANNKLFYAHRVAWLIMTGRWPKDQIDHIDGDKANNRWVNLREATASQNQYNRGLNKNNTSGVRGVYYVSRLKQWQAQIVYKGKNNYLGVFVSKKEAESAYLSAAKIMHGDFMRT